MRRNLILLVAAVVAAFPLSAAVLRFEFTGDRSGDPPLRFVGHGFVDRQAFRYDYEEGNHPLFSGKMSIRSADGGKILAVVDNREGTYFFRATESMSGMMSNFRAPWQTGIRSPVVAVENLGREESPDGLQLSRVRLTIRYTVLMELEGEAMSAAVDATAELVVAPKYRNPALPWGHQFALKTGWPEVDEKIADAVVKLGFPMEQTVEVTRTIEGGIEDTERSTFRVTRLRDVAFAAAGFSPPPGYRALEPTLVGPSIADTGEAFADASPLETEPSNPVQKAEAAAAPLPIEEIAPGTAPPLFMETLEVRVVNVDVVVRDKNGKPVSGLTPDDFEVLENGQPVEITNFLEVSSSGGTLGETATGDGNVATTSDEPRRRRKLVLYIDRTAVQPQNRKNLIPAMKSFVSEAMRAGDEVMLASYQNGLRIDLQFTSNRDVVLEKIDRMVEEINIGLPRSRQYEAAQKALLDMVIDGEVRGGPRSGGALGAEKPPYEAGIAECRVYADTVLRETNVAIGSLEALMKGLQAIDGRKVLVFATEALPTRPGNEIFAFFDGIKARYADGENKNPIAEGLRYDLSAQIDELADTANQAGFTLYPIQAVSLSAGFNSAERSGAMGFEFDVATREAADLQRQSDEDGLRSLARLTGGVATFGANDFSGAFDAVISDLEHYYSIGYRAGGERSNFVRSIRVKTKNPDLVARTKRSHVDRSIETEMEEYVAANLFYPIERNDMGIQAKASEPVPAEENVKLTLTVEVPTASLALIPQADQVYGKFTLFIGFVRADGSVSKIARDTREFRFPAETMPRRKSITMALEVTMDSSTDRISVGVLDPVSKATGFASAFVPRTESAASGL